MHKLLPSSIDYFFVSSYPNHDPGYQHNSMKEVQKLTIKGSMKREVQRVKFEELTDGNFRLEYSVMNANGIRSSDFTQLLPWNASASQISQELNSLETTNEHISVSRFSAFVLSPLESMILGLTTKRSRVLLLISRLISSYLIKES